MNAESRIPVALLLLALFAAAPASAQTEAARLEVGGQIATLRLSDFGATNAGLGGRVSYDLARWIAVEAEANVFTNDDFELRLAPDIFSGATLGYSRRRVEGFAGPKIGLRRERFGLFGKVRPGFARLTDKGINCVGEVCALMLLARPIYRTEPALDLGAVLEFYPTPRTVARVDLGSTLIRHRSTVPPCTGCTSSNFASRFGVGVRF